VPDDHDEHRDQQSGLKLKSPREARSQQAGDGEGDGRRGAERAEGQGTERKVGIDSPASGERAATGNRIVAAMSTMATTPSSTPDRRGGGASVTRSS